MPGDRQAAGRVIALIEINRTTGTGFMILTHDERIAAHCPAGSNSPTAISRPPPA